MPIKIAGISPNTLRKRASPPVDWVNPPVLDKPGKSLNTCFNVRPNQLWFIISVIISVIASPLTITCVVMSRNEIVETYGYSTDLFENGLTPKSCGLLLHSPLSSRSQFKLQYCEPNPPFSDTPSDFIHIYDLTSKQISPFSSNFPSETTSNHHLRG